MKQKISSKTISLVFAVLVICFLVGFYVLAAWTEPTASPPAGNVPAPINVSTVAQNKLGDFGIGGGVGQPIYWLSNVGGTLRFVRTSPDVATKLVIGQDGNVGIGTPSPSTKLHVVGGIRVTGLTSCNTIDTDASGNLVCGTDETGAGGGITQLSQGTGITLSPNPITATGTISANTTYLQRRVSATCASNQAIRVINADGTVTCVNLPPSAICTWGSKTYSTGAECCGGSSVPTYSRFTCTASGTWSKDGICATNPHYVTCGK